MDQLVREAYEETWSSRRTPPIVMKSWVDNDWAKGRTDYLTLLIRVDDPVIHEATTKLQKVLSQNRCVDCFPSEYLHVTVKEIACFLVEEDPAEDELTHEQLGRLAEAAKNVLSGFESFTIAFENINHFRSTIVVEAHNDGHIREMNSCLM